MNDDSTEQQAAPRERRDIRTPVTILSGFLGSGKTTIMNRALRDPSMLRTAVVINEFGEISIDHALTTASNDTILVLENGCLCCTVFGDLVQTLNRLYYSREAGEIAFNQILIETSGLADVAPVVQAFLSEPTLEGLYRVDSLVTVVDAVNGPGTLAEHAVAVRQIALADCLLITKLDLLPQVAQATALADLQSSLRQLNRTASIWTASDPQVDLVRLICHSSADSMHGSRALTTWLDAAIKQDPAAHDHEPGHHGQNKTGHSHDSAISSFSLIRETPVPREALQLLLTSLEKHLGPSLLRVKGLVNVAEEPGQPAVIQGAQHLLHNLTWLDRWPDNDHRTRIVFITHGIAAADLSELIGLLDRVAQRTANARLRAGAAGN
jgi:G3E family GTPase